MGLDDPKLLLGHVSFDGQACVTWVLYFKEWTGTIVVKQLLSFKICQSIHAWVAISGLILSLTTDIMYISMFPGFWKWIPMICMQKLLMTTSTAFVDSLSV